MYTYLNVHLFTYVHVCVDMYLRVLTHTYTHMCAYAYILHTPSTHAYILIIYAKIRIYKYISFLFFCMYCTHTVFIHMLYIHRVGGLRIRMLCATHANY